ncbi:MAG: S-layer protein, partial [Fuerstia sp.]|nr:S-layer protein [Fuerstiella sp.]
MTFSVSQIAVLLSLACIGVPTPADAAEPVSFNNDVVPVLTRFGCNAGGCHGKLAGQNGFRLSLRGYAPELDHATITREALGRRINAASPGESLLVRKAANLIPHGGGQRLEPGGKAAQILTAWIAAGALGPR